MRVPLFVLLACVDLILQWAASSENLANIENIGKLSTKGVLHQSHATFPGTLPFDSTQKCRKSLATLFLSLGQAMHHDTKARQNLNHRSVLKIRRVGDPAQILVDDEDESRAKPDLGSEYMRKRNWRTSLETEISSFREGKGEIIEFLRDFVPIYLIFSAIRLFVVAPFYIPSESMYPTMKVYDQFVAEKVTKWKTGGTFHPDRRDIIVFQPPKTYYDMTNGSGNDVLIKRVVAVEGDNIEVSDGRVYINGKAQVEPYINEPPDYLLEKMEVPPGYVFCLGDNRNDSFDSHYWGFLPVENIVGRAYFRYWPPDKVGSLEPDKMYSTEMLSPYIVPS